MKLKFRNFFGYLIAVCGLVISSSAIGEVENVEKRFDVSSGGTLNLNSDRGSIELESWDRSEILIEVRKKARNQERLDEFKLTFDQKGSDVYVDGDSDWNSKVSIKYKIKVPAEFNLDLKTGGGSIKVGDVSGKIKVHTSGGSIKIGNVAQGEVDANTSGGSIKVGDVNGNLKVDTSGGSIKIGEVTGTSDINTSGGSIGLASGGNDVKADTSGGNIKIGPVSGNVEVDTSGGSIKIGMSQGDVKAETSGGSIKVEGAKGKVNVDTSGGSIAVASSGGPVVADTAGGNIRIKQANGYIEAQTAGGSIEAEMIATSGDTHVKLESAGGSITLYIDRSLAATVDARLRITRSAKRDYRIYSDFPLTIQGEKSDRITGKGDINGGGDRIQLSTTNGDIYIKTL